MTKPRRASPRGAALWGAIGVERLPGMLAGACAREAAIALPQPSEADELVADYRSLGLTLGRHPLALLCQWLGKLETNSRDFR